jgi:hypothetical protein
MISEGEMRSIAIVSLIVLLTGVAGCGSASDIQVGVPDDAKYTPAPPVMGPNTNFKDFAKKPQQVKAASPPATPPPGQVE